MVDKDLADKLVQIATKQLWTSRQFKAPRLKQLDKYEDAYNGRVKEKMRVTFNVPFPVLSGLVDTLLADFDDPINLQFKENDPADYNGIKKVNAAWVTQKDSLNSDLMWDMKLRWDRKEGVMTGRGIQKFFCESDPEFRQRFRTIKLKNFEFEPKGGGHLENHLFCGESNVEKTESEINEMVEAGVYNKDEFEKMKSNHGSSEYRPTSKNSQLEDFLGNFRSLGLDPETHNYIGEKIYYLCEWGLTYEGTRYYLVFDPYSQGCLRAEELKEVTESNLWPWTSWATHEDSENFLSKCYCDDFYLVHDAIGTMVSQELTNRAKQNLNARAYDPEMFPDVAKLDKAGYRPDALVPFDSKGGVRKVQDGLYEFTTPELKGTIDLVNWLESALSRDTGVTEMQMAGVQKGKANVQYSLLQQAQKRISFKAHSYSQCYTEIGLRYLWGLKEHMPTKLMVQLTGPEGTGWDELRRDEINFRKQPNVKIINITEQDKNNVLGKDQKIKALTDIIGNQILIQQNNPRKLNEIYLRDVGGWDDQTIFELMDTQNFASKDVMAEADRAIQQLVKGKMPDICYIANIAFLQRIQNFAKTHHVTLKEKVNLFTQYIMQVAPIAMENMVSLAAQLKLQGGQQGQQPAEGQTPPTGQGGAPQGQMPVNRQNPAAQVTPRMQPMAVGGSNG